MLANIFQRVQREPVLLTTFVTAVLALLTVFGLPLSDAQTTALVGVVAASGALIARSRVAPNAKDSQ